MNKRMPSKTLAITAVQKIRSPRARHLILNALFVFFLLLATAGCATPTMPWESWSENEREKDVSPVLVTIPGGSKVQGIYHTINRGETLWRIAKTYDIDLQLLAELNDIEDPAQIKAGEKLFILGATEQKQVAVKNIAANITPPLAPAPEIITDKSAFIWPVEGKVISNYGVRNGLRYEGIEIAAVEGTTVRAANNGKVVYDGKLKGYGNIIILKHKGDFKTVYAYNRVNLVTLERDVSKGEAIATVGKSGGSSRSSLHFQVWKGDTSRNPLFFLP